jgi:hypothetical protein
VDFTAKNFNQGLIVVIFLINAAGKFYLLVRKEENRAIIRYLFAEFAIVNYPHHLLVTLILYLKVFDVSRLRITIVNRIILKVDRLLAHLFDNY